MSINKKLLSTYIQNMVAIIIGTFFMGFAFNVFQAPNHITPTGFSGIATIVSYGFSTIGVTIPPSPIYLGLNVILFVFAYKTLGKEFCIYSATGILGYALSMQVLSYIHLDVGNDLLLCCLYGGCLMGVGTGIVIRFGGSTGGADMSAVLLRKFIPHLSTGTLIVIIDGIIIGISAMIFGINMGMYSLISCLLMGNICDLIVSGHRSVTAYYIITNKKDELSKALLERVHRGLSNIKITGMYSGQEHDMLFVVVRRYEISTLKHVINEVDPTAFMIAVNVREAIGVGFETLHVDDKPKLKFKKHK